MAYDGKLLAKARAELEDIKGRNQAEQQRRKAEIYSKIPEISSIDSRMRAQMVQLVRMTLSRTPDLKDKIDRLHEENTDLKMRKAELLHENGYPIEYLDDIYFCPKCRDSGIYENSVCTCIDRLYNKALTNELGVLLKNGDESFEGFDLNYYPTTLDARTGVIPREAMTLVLAACRKFADNFPNVSSNLILQGNTGLGKTYLSACIARAVAQKGCSVCYDTAASALEAFEKQKFSRDAEEAEACAAKVRRMLDCDLMILDDLGTEMTTALSISALYTLINTRLVNSRPTVISTNLTNAELEKRYNAQISSRIEGEFLSLRFAGDDIRLLKKGSDSK